MQSGESVAVERGFALIAILALAALFSAFLIASALNFTSAGISNEREQRSMNALRQAKTALIAYAASEQWQLYRSPTTYFQPGALPCPDQDDDGDADCAFGSNTASMIGRLPFKTLGIDELRDASGERLWYALSHDFRKNRCPGSGCTTINSDTLGQLTVTGTAPATQVVAIVFAPGGVIQGQNRDPTNASVHNDPLNYLDGPPNLSDPVNYVFTTNALPSDTFNDRVLVITQADLMAAVEPVVAARIERDIKPYLIPGGLSPTRIACLHRLQGCRRATVGVAAAYRRPGVRHLANPHLAGRGDPGIDHFPELHRVERYAGRLHCGLQRNAYAQLQSCRRQRRKGLRPKSRHRRPNGDRVGFTAFTRTHPFQRQ